MKFVVVFCTYYLITPTQVLESDQATLIAGVNLFNQSSSLLPCWFNPHHRSPREISEESLIEEIKDVQIVWLCGGQGCMENREGDSERERRGLGESEMAAEMTDRRDWVWEFPWNHQP
jgi:hypothetical protein